MNKYIYLILLIAVISVSCVIHETALSSEEILDEFDNPNGAINYATGYEDTKLKCMINDKVVDCEELFKKAKDNDLI